MLTAAEGTRVQLEVKYLKSLYFVLQRNTEQVINICYLYTREIQASDL